MEKIGVFYGSTEGNTERIVKKLQKSMTNATLHRVDVATFDDIAKYNILIFATSTWHTGELQEDWKVFLDTLGRVNFHGKKMAFIGVGDSEYYPDTFVDGMGIIYERIANSGADFLGAWPTDGYSFEASRGIVDGKFLGLAVDEDNDPEKTEARIAAWTEQVKGELKIFSEQQREKP